MSVFQIRRTGGSWVWRLALAVVSVAGATVATGLLGAFNADAPYALYYLAVFAAAVYGGRLPAGVAIVLSAGAANYRFVSPASAPALRPNDLFSTGLFMAVATLLAWLVHHLRQRDLAVRQLNRLHSALRRINQGIVRLPTREELFAHVCGALVADGGFRLAWITWHDPARRVLAPVAHYGDHQGFLDGVLIATDDRPEARGPSGTAFREGRHVICNDLAHDPSTRPWHDAVRARGFRAAAALPIRLGGEPAGTLTVYADEVGFFGDREVDLLVQVAADISFGLDNLAREAAREAAAEEASRERRFSETLIDSVPGILYLYDVHGRFLRWNRNFELVSGYSGDEIARMHPVEFFREEDRAMLVERIGEVFARGESWVEAPFRRKDGTTVPYHFTGRHLVLEQGDCLIGVGIDLSDRARAEEALRSSEALLQAASRIARLGAWSVELPARTVIWSDALRSILDVPEGEDLDFATAVALYPPAWRDQVIAAFDALVTAGTPFDLEVESDTVAGRRIWVRIFGEVARRDGDAITLVHGALQDITARKQTEMLLRDAKQGLERTVDERTAALKTALERAEAADRLKSAFLATMSHELRTPLNSIIGFTGILLQDMAGPINAEQRKQLGMVRGSARHLLELIGDVLDISKIEAGQLEVRSEPVDVAAAIARTVDAVRPFAAGKGLSLDVEMPPNLAPILSDRRRVDQILLNLLNNAVKFTDTGGVRLVADEVDAFRATPDAMPGPAVRLRVSDTGIGIAPGDLATLFQPFRQVDSGLTRQHEGTGLGLAICRRLADLLGGTITAESMPGAGSTFTVTLPLRPARMSHER